MIKKILLVVLLCILAGVIMPACTNRFFAGILYPKTIFWYTGIERHYPLNIWIARGSTANSFKSVFWFTINVDRQYEILRIREMSYEWEGNTGNIPSAKGRYTLLNNYVRRDNGLYEYFSDTFFKINPERFFKGKNIGDKFKFYVRVVYSFDDEPEKIQVAEFDVEVVEGVYHDPIYGHPMKR